MRLGNVFNKLFRKKTSEELFKRNEHPAEDIYESVNNQIGEDSRFERTSEHINIEQSSQATTLSERKSKKYKYIVVGASIVFFLIFVSLLGVLYVRISSSAFREDRVSIVVNGPEVVSIGEKVEYTIVVTNKNRVKLEDAIVGLNLPSNFKLEKNRFIVDKNLSGVRINIGEIQKRSTQIYKIKALVTYENDAQLFLKAFMRYKPTNVSSSFQSNVAKNIRLEQSKIQASVFAADNISSGELVELVIMVKNIDKQQYDKLILEIEYPEGFEFDSSTVKFFNEEHSIWVIKNLKPNTQQEIKVLGKLIGRVDSVKSVKITIAKELNGESVVFRGEKNIKIIPSKIILEQAGDKHSVYPGEFVNYKVSFKNNSTIPLNNLILKVHLPNKFIKQDAVKHQSGYYNNKENVIIWKAGDIDKLKILQPGEEGQVNFSVQVQNDILPKEGQDKNPYVSIYSEIESLDVDSPVFENKKIVTDNLKTLINSILMVTGTIKYLPEDNDGGADEYLQVGKKMFLRVKLELRNTTNDLRNVKLVADFPSGVSWERQIYPEGDSLDFHKRSNELEWNLGSVGAGTGFTSLSETAEFIISVTPSVNQVGHELSLIKEFRATARDIFTQNNIEYQFKTIRSNVIEGLKGGVVVSE